MNNSKNVLGKYDIIFFHENFNQKNTNKMDNKLEYPNYNGRTYCTISAEDFAVRAYTTCHSSDNFNKAIGRRNAFKTAVSEINSKTTRKRLWAWFKRESPASFRRFK